MVEKNLTSLAKFYVVLTQNLAKYKNWLFLPNISNQQKLYDYAILAVV